MLCASLFGAALCSNAAHGETIAVLQGLDKTTARISTFEALLRWPHPRLGNIPPLDFLPLAEEGGLMRPLTSFVLEQALAQCARWRAEGRRLLVSCDRDMEGLVALATERQRARSGPAIADPLQPFLIVHNFRRKSATRFS